MRFAEFAKEPFTPRCTRMCVMNSTRRLIRIMIIVSIMLSTPMCVETFYFYLFKTNFVFEKAGGQLTSSSLSVNLSLKNGQSRCGGLRRLRGRHLWFCGREAGNGPREPCAPDRVCPRDRRTHRAAARSTCIPMLLSQFMRPMQP